MPVVSCCGLTVVSAGTWEVDNNVNTLTNVFLLLNIRIISSVHFVVSFVEE